MNGAVLYGGPPPRGTGGPWTPYPGDVVLYGCPPPEQPFTPSIPSVVVTNTPWLEAQLAEMQKVLTATQRELTAAHVEIARLKARPARRRDRRKGNAP